MTTRGRAVVREVYYGDDLDNQDIVDEREKDRRSGKFCDAWLDDEIFITEGIKIHRSIARSLFVGDFQGRQEIMPRCWYEGDEKRGIKIVEVDWGPIETHEFSFSGSLNAGDEDELEFEVDDKIMLVRMRVRGKGAVNCQLDLHKKNAAGNFVEEVASITWSSPRETSDLIGEIIKDEQAIAPKIVNAGGARNVVLHVDFVRLG